VLYAYSMTVEQPAEMYDKVNAELEEELHRPLPQGCLVHLATRTATGLPGHGGLGVARGLRPLR